MSGGNVSVVITTHDRAAILGDTVESVLRQTHGACHAIVVDDGSTDDTEELVADRFGDERRVTYVRQAHRGVAAARNAGLALAKGEYIAFLDPGDVMQPWKLELQVACLERLRKSGVGMLWTDHDVVDPEGAIVAEKANRRSYDAYQQFAIEEMFTSSASLREIVRGLPDPGVDTRLYWGDVFSCIALGDLCPTPSVLLSRERARAVGGFDESLAAGEEHDYHLRACAAGPAGMIDIAAMRRRVETTAERDEEAELARAEGAWHTVLAALERSRERLQLDEPIIHRNFAELHRRIARARLATDDRVRARRHLIYSLVHEPRTLGTWSELALATLPQRLSERIRRRS